MVDEWSYPAILRPFFRVALPLHATDVATRKRTKPTDRPKKSKQACPATQCPGSGALGKHRSPKHSCCFFRFARYVRAFRYAHKREISCPMGGCSLRRAQKPNGAPLSACSIRGPVAPLPARATRGDIHNKSASRRRLLKPGKDCFSFLVFSKQYPPRAQAKSRGIQKNLPVS
jgi:hypothetical protein